MNLLGLVVHCLFPDHFDHHLCRGRYLQSFGPSRDLDPFWMVAS